MPRDYDPASPPPYNPPSKSEPNVEAVMATLAHLFAARGDAQAVAVLAEAAGAVALQHQEQDWGEDYYYYTLRLTLKPNLYARLDTDREALAKRLGESADEITRGHDPHEVVSTVLIIPALATTDGWRASAKGWLRGEGITNQGRVRSDNIAARQHDGLLFRSQPEINLYHALKVRGVYMAPLPVFVRGGKTYQRLEPDFLILHRGVAMMVEVDGSTVHRESPAEAHARTEGLAKEGVRVHRVAAADCATPVAADATAQRVLEALERYRELGH